MYDKIENKQLSSNLKSWQDSSDGWVSTMNKSKENKEEYQKYLTTTEKPVPYRDWLREIKNNDI